MVKQPENAAPGGSGDPFAQLGDSFYKELLDNMHDGVYFVDLDRRITYWNKGAERLTGYAQGEAVGRCCRDNLLVHVDHDGCNLCDTACPVSATLGDGEVRAADVLLKHKQGHRVPVRVRVAPIRDDGGIIRGAVETFSDNSRQFSLRQRVKELERTALLDPVTELGNRRYGEDCLAERLDRFHGKGEPFGVLFIDIDHFKSVNDEHGHEVGDRVLHMVAQTLINTMRVTDSLARWGGEEFLGIVREKDAEHLLAVAERCCAMVAESRVPVRETDVSVTISIGATMASHGDDMDSIVNRADKLMYLSKISGRARATCDV